MPGQRVARQRRVATARPSPSIYSLYRNFRRSSPCKRESLPEFVDEYPLVLRVVDWHDDEMHAFVGKRLLEDRLQFINCTHPRSLGAVCLGILHEVGVVERHAEIGE